MDAQKYKQTLLTKLFTPYRECTGCHFDMPRATQIVFGEGNPDAGLLFIGEAPGRDEDAQGRPFVGRSGKLLNQLIDLGGSSRDQVYITNIVKIRPPNNRKPTPLEIERGKPLLASQIKIIRPRLICTLGSSALEGLLGHQVKISQLRGKQFTWNGTPVLPTYHPAYILRNPKELKTLAHDIETAIQQSS